MAGTVAPVIKHQFFDNNGAPAVGYKLFVYLTGTTTKTNTWTDAALSSLNANPIVLDSAGRASIFLNSALTYKFVLAPPTDTDPPGSPVWTIDGTQAISLQASSVIDISVLSNGAIAVGDLVCDVGGVWDKWAAASGSSVKLYGFARTSTSGFSQSLTVRVAGIVPTAGLVSGAYYYAGSTAGTIAASPPAGSPAFRVGMALSPTELLIPPTYQTLIPREITVVASAANSGTSETDLTGYSRTIPQLGWRDGDSLWIKGCGTLASNTNTKTLRIDVGGQKVTLITNTTNVATNRWTCDLLVTRTSNTTARLTGTTTFDATTGAAPTTWHFTPSIGSLSWDTLPTTIKLTGQSNTASNDITAETAIIVEFKQ